MNGRWLMEVDLPRPPPLGYRGSLVSTAVKEWISENMAGYSITTIAMVGLAALFFFKKVIKLAVIFGLLAAAFGAGFLYAA